METKDPIKSLREELEVCGCDPDECMTCSVPRNVEAALDEIAAQYVRREELDVAEAAHRSKALRVKELENNLAQANSAREHWKAKAEAARGELADLKAKVETHYMRLPVDADSVPIMLGDEVSIIGFEEGVVASIEINDRGFVYVGVCPHGWGVPTRCTPEEVTHAKPDTVESVLMEAMQHAFSEPYRSGNLDMSDVLGGYAERIRKAVHDGD